MQWAGLVISKATHRIANREVFDIAGLYIIYIYLYAAESIIHCHIVGGPHPHHQMTLQMQYLTATHERPVSPQLCQLRMFFRLLEI